MKHGPADQKVFNGVSIDYSTPWAWRGCVSIPTGSVQSIESRLDEGKSNKKRNILKRLTTQSKPREQIRRSHNEPELLQPLAHRGHRIGLHVVRHEFSPNELGDVLLEVGSAVIPQRRVELVHKVVGVDDVIDNGVLQPLRVRVEYQSVIGL